MRASGRGGGWATLPDAPCWMVYLSMLLLLSTFASASDGAYVVGPADASLYVGLDAERIATLAGAEGSYDPSVVPVDDGVSKLTGKAILSYGLAPRTELEITLPFGYNHVNRTDGALCAALGGTVCKTTAGLGVVSAQGKFLLADELDGAPLSVSVGGLARFGQATWATRNRVTNLGEGTFDVGGVLGLGRSGGLGARGYWASSLTAGAVYRFPNVSGDGDAVAVPAPETFGRLEVLLAPTGTWSFGPEVDWFFRGGEQDIETSNPADPDWLGALRVQKVSAGGAVFVRARQGVILNAGALANVWAVNNPASDLLVSVGVQVNQLARREDR